MIMMIYDTWWWYILLNMFNLYADVDAKSMTPSRNTRSYTLQSVPSSPGRSFLSRKKLTNRPLSRGHSQTTHFFPHHCFHTNFGTYRWPTPISNFLASHPHPTHPKSLTKIHGFMYFCIFVCISACIFVLSFVFSLYFVYKYKL